MAKSLRLTSFIVILSLCSCGKEGGKTPSASTSAVKLSSEAVSSSSPVGTNPSGTLNCGGSPFSPNFCNDHDPTNGQLNYIHWWDHLPLKIYFTSSPTVQGQNVNNLVMSAFNYWSSVIFKTVATKVNTQQEADVVVSYENFATMPLGTWIGYSSWNYFPWNYQTFNGNITIRTWDNMTAQEVSNGLLQTSQHEFGHMLFLGGHSEASPDTMYPYGQTDVYKPLTQRDQNSIKTAVCDSFPR